MYVKITNGTVDQYPYTIGQLRRDNPQTSFPKQISNELLESYGIFPVDPVAQPEYNYTKNTTQGTPVLVDNKWTQVWVTVDATAEEISNREAQQADRIRNQRNVLLTESDWTQVADAPVDAASWATYRQALRDITSHANFPFLQEADWPVKPQ